MWCHISQSPYVIAISVLFRHEIRALQLIILAVFGALDEYINISSLVWKSSVKTTDSLFVLHSKDEFS